MATWVAAKDITQNAGNWQDSLLCWYTNTLKTILNLLLRASGKNKSFSKGNWSPTLEKRDQGNLLPSLKTAYTHKHDPSLLVHDNLIGYHKHLSIRTQFYLSSTCTARHEFGLSNVGVNQKTIAMLYYVQITAAHQTIGPKLLSKYDIFLSG